MPHLDHHRHRLAYHLGVLIAAGYSEHTFRSDVPNDDADVVAEAMTLLQRTFDLLDIEHPDVSVEQAAADGIVDKLRYVSHDG